METFLKLKAKVYKIPEFPSDEFDEFCEEHRITPLGGDAETSRKGWCEWMNEYIRNGEYLVYLEDHSGAFFCTQEYLDRVKLVESNA